MLDGACVPYKKIAAACFENACFMLLTLSDVHVDTIIVLFIEVFVRALDSFIAVVHVGLSAGGGW